MQQYKLYGCANKGLHYVTILFNRGPYWEDALTWRRVISAEQEASPKAASKAKVMADRLLQLVKSAQNTDSQ